MTLLLIQNLKKFVYILKKMLSSKYDNNIEKNATFSRD